MSRSRSVLPLVAVSSLAWLPGTVLAHGSPGSFGRIGTLEVPGKPLAAFDIGFVNGGGIYALSDRSNAGIDLFNATTGKFLGRATGFKGYVPAEGRFTAGPNGVVAVGRHEFWAGDGDGSVKVVDARSRKIIASVATGGHKRADELTYDPRDHLVVVVDNADDPPFVSFISNRSRRLVGRLELTRATEGAEQPVWDPAAKLIYLSIPELDHVRARGAIAVIDPRDRKLIRFMPVDRCMPSGLALGPHDDLLVGCSDDAVAAGFPARSYVMSTRSGKIVARLPQIGGSDEVWSDPGTARYYLGAVANTGGPVLGVVDSHTNRWLENLPTGPGAHSVAADPGTSKVFVPISAGGSAAECRRGCIAVFGPRPSAPPSP